MFYSRNENLNTSVKNGDSKSMDRNLAKVAQDPKNTIMTAHEPKYPRERLDMADAARQDMVILPLN